MQTETTRLVRNDVHRPSVINPQDYDFVALGHVKIECFGDVLIVEGERARLAAHMKMTGGTWSQHEHGGNCHICGAGCIYTVIFYHQATNSYIRTGNDCAFKLDMGDQDRFKRFVEACKAAEHHRAGKLKAQGILEAAGLGMAWGIYGAESDEKEETIVRDIVRNVVKWGSLSEKQEKYLRVLLDRINRRAEIMAQREAEKALAKDARAGRFVVEGVVIKTEEKESDFGFRTVMTVKTSEGWIAWGSAVGNVSRGDRVRFKATFTVSPSDPKFAFYKRPTDMTPAPADESPL